MYSLTPDQLDRVTGGTLLGVPNFDVGGSISGSIRVKVVRSDNGNTTEIAGGIDVNGGVPPFNGQGQQQSQQGGGGGNGGAGGNGGRPMPTPATNPLGFGFQV